MSGKFITFEGVDGGGKSTQAKHLATWLREDGERRVLETREPGGTELGEKLRELLLNGGDKSAITETLLLFAARQEHLQKKILPALAEGVWVVCDRFSDSSVAYQGGGRGVSADFLAALVRHVQDGFAPDLTIYIQSPPALAASPLLLAADAFERENGEFYRRVADAYDDIAKHEPQRVAVVAAFSGDKKKKRRSEKEVAKEIRQIVDRRLLRPSAARRPV